MGAVCDWLVRRLLGVSEQASRPEWREGPAVATRLNQHCKLPSARHRPETRMGWEWRDGANRLVPHCTLLRTGGVLAALRVVDWMPANVVQQLRHGELRQVDESQDVLLRFSRENRSSFAVYPLLESSCEFRRDGAGRRLGFRVGKLSGRQTPGSGNDSGVWRAGGVVTWESKERPRWLGGKEFGSSAHL